MKKKIRVQTSLVDRLISEGVTKTMEKSGSSFKTVENVVEVGTICLDKKEFILFSADKDDRAIGANYRIGEKEGSEYKTRPVMIDLVNNTIKITKDEGSWTQEMKIKKISIDNTDVPEIPVEQNITEGKVRSSKIIAEGNIPPFEADEEGIFTYRNYNIGRSIDGQTDAFENELDELIKKYGAYMETDSFENH